MARKRGVSNQRLQVPAANGNPPPSTIAAQIVNNASNINGPEEPATKVAFSQLLQEYLNDPSTDESNSQLNAQLVAVVAEAGLDPLLQHNPFSQDLPILQAIDSIAAIKLTIERRPHLLLTVKDRGDDASNGPALFIRLFPKLLGLLGHPDLELIQESLHDLLRTCIDMLYRKPDMWHRATSLTNLLRACVDSKYNTLVVLSKLINCKLSQLPLRLLMCWSKV